VARAEIVWAELERRELEIDFADGSRWRLKAAGRKRIEPLVDELRASLL
jgi:hypothetical protein